MTPEEFVNGLIAGGSTNITDYEDDVDYCPVHAWDIPLYHQDDCPAYAAKLERTRW